MISVDYINIVCRDERVATFCPYFIIFLVSLFLATLVVGLFVCGPDRRVMFPFLVLNFLSGTGPKGHRSSTSSTSRSNYNSAHGHEGRHVDEDRGGAVGSRDEVALDGLVDRRGDIIHTKVVLQLQPLVDVSLI